MEGNKHIGSNFDDFLKDEGTLEEVEEVVAKKIFVFQEEMKKKESVWLGYEQPPS